MPVVSAVELARSLDLELRGTPVAKRTWAVTLPDNTLQNNPPTEDEIWTECGLSDWGTPHPSITALKLKKLSIAERYQDSPYHVQVVAEYGICTANDLLDPLSRTADWSFDGQPAQVPAFYYYDGQTQKPLTNSAYDFFEGLVTDESMIRATIQKNYATLPGSQIAAQNCVNDAQYLGLAQHSWKVAAVKAAFTREVYNNVEYSFWATNIELLYRQTGWNLRIPDVGWNFLDGGQKRRAMVFDFQNGEWVASANPVGLNASGNQTNGEPNLLNRRVNPEADFSNLFGNPPA